VIQAELVCPVQRSGHYSMNRKRRHSQTFTLLGGHDDSRHRDFIVHGADLDTKNVALTVIQHRSLTFNNPLAVAVVAR
jgi:hypothetical protein